METPSYQDPSQNGPPSSTGPGARPNNSRDTSTILQEMAEMGSDQRTSVKDTSLTLGYDLNNLSRRYTIPFQNMPLNPATTWLLYGGPLRTRATGTFVIDTIRGTENVVKRRLTQAEVEGITLHSSRRTLYSFAAWMSAFSIGYGVAALGRQEMKFPFRKPQPLERYDHFPSQRLPMMRGQYARIMWHITRANMYVFIGLLVLQPLYMSMGDSAMMVGLYRDERTKELLKTMNEKNQVRRIENNRDRQRTGQGRAMQKSQQSQQQEGIAQQYEDPDSDGYYTDTEKGVVNDYGGGREYSGDNAYTDGTTDTEMLDDPSMRQQELQQSSPTSFSQPRAQTSISSSPSSSDPDPDYFFEDDASPTARYSPSSSAQSSSGSVWDRIRKSTRADASTKPQQQQNRKGIAPSGTQRRRPLPGQTGAAAGSGADAETRGDGFSFETGDEERQLAKEMAQREFDSILERERRTGAADGTAGGFGSGGREESGGASAWERRRGRSDN